MTPALRPVLSLQCLPAAGSRLCPVRSSSGGHFSYTGSETRAWASLHQLGPWCQDHDVNRLEWDVDLPKELGPGVWPCPVQG